ncbi:uncharacterized protein NPIL_135091 [Nephila pilipes]|uniref:Uncharacterized protein n=1 Tax=Nephila pilipes TaxID=299642 RepID=A0A8X6PPH6_NEPPI|nr:uncharacterized protein NPIL_135091 [Nephila pilipes]
MDDFLKLKNKHSTYRTQLTKLFAKIETNLNDQYSDLETLENKLELLLIKYSTIKELNSETEISVKSEEIKKEIDKCSEHEDKVIIYKTKLKKRIKQLQPESDQNYSVNNSTLNSAEENSIRILTEINTVKLPKLMISKYYGDPDKYLDFMNQYENAFHNNPSLSNIDKCNYLKSLLGGKSSQRSFIQKNLSRQLSLNKVGEEEFLIPTFASKVPTRIKCARVQVKIRHILDKDEVIIEALEIVEVTSAPPEFAPIDIINELKTKGINLCDVDYGVFGN